LGGTPSPISPQEHNDMSEDTQEQAGEATEAAAASAQADGDQGAGETADVPVEEKPAE
jgi:hypothetical protein